MITVSIVCFIIAALLGATLLTYVLTNKPTPKGIAILHGTFAALGLIFLLISAFDKKSLWLWVAFFAVVAIFGFYMFTRDMLGKGVPKTIALIHGSVAILLFGSLLYFLFYIDKTGL